MSELMLAAVRKFRFTLEDLLGANASVYFENIFATRHIGRVVDLMLYQCRGFIQSAQDPGYSEYRFRHIVELLVFNGWSNYRRGEKAKVIETEIGWSDTRLVISVGFLVDEEAAGFVPGSQTPANPLSERMAKMFTHVQELADGLIIRHDPRTGRVQALAFISNRDEQKAAPEYVDMRTVPEPPPGEPASASPVEPVELSSGDVDSFLAEDNAAGAPGSVEPGRPDEVVVKGGAGAEQDADVVVKGGPGAERDANVVVSGGPSNVDNTVTRVGGGQTQTVDNSVTRVAGGPAPVVDKTVTRIEGARGQTVDNTSRTVSGGKVEAQSESVTRFAAPEKGPVEKETIVKFAADKGPTGRTDAQISRREQLLAEQIQALQAQLQKTKSENAPTGPKDVTRFAADKKVAPGDVNKPNKREQLLAQQIQMLQAQLEAGRNQRKGSTSSAAGAAQPDARSAAQIVELQRQLEAVRSQKGGANQQPDARATAQIVELQRQLEALKAEKSGPTQQQGADWGTGAGGAAALPPQVLAMQKQIEALERDKKKLMDVVSSGALKQTGDKGAAANAQVLQKQIDALKGDKQKLQEALVSVKGAEAGDKVSASQLGALQRQIDALKGDREKLSEALSAARGTAAERVSVTQVEAFQAKIEALEADKKKLHDAMSGSKGAELQGKAALSHLDDVQKRVAALEDDKRKLQEMMLANSEAVRMAHGATDQLQTYQKKIAALEEERQKLKQTVMGAAGKPVADTTSATRITALEKELEALHADRKKLEDAVAESGKVAREAAMAEKHAGALEKKLHVIEDDRAKLREALTEKNLALKESYTAAQMTALKHQIESLREENEELTKAMAESNRQATEALAKVADDAHGTEHSKKMNALNAEIDIAQVPETAKNMARGMMESIVKERAELNKRTKEVEAIYRKTEREFKVREKVLIERVRKLEDTLKQRDTAIERGKDTLANLSETIEKLREETHDNKAKSELQHKLATAEKIILAERDNVERIQGRLEELQEKLNDEGALRTNVINEVGKYKRQAEELQHKMKQVQDAAHEGTAMELQTLTEQRNKDAKIIEQFKRQTLELQTKLNAATQVNKTASAAQGADKKGATQQSEAELKHKLDLAERLAKNSKDEFEKLKKRMDDAKVLEGKLRADVAKLQADLTKAQTELKATNLRTQGATVAAAAAAAAKPPGGAKK